MYISKSNKFWHQLSSFVATFWAGVNWKFMQLMDLKISCRCIHTGYQARKGLHTGTVTTDSMNFVILNSHVTVIYLRMIKNTYIYAVNRKIENSCIGFFQARKQLTIKWHLSENVTFQNLLKIRKLLSAEKFGNILTFDKESKRKPNHLYEQTVLVKIIYILL